MWIPFARTLHTVLGRGDELSNVWFADTFRINYVEDVWTASALLHTPRADTITDRGAENDVIAQWTSMASSHSFLSYFFVFMKSIVVVTLFRYQTYVFFMNPSEVFICISYYVFNFIDQAQVLEVWVARINYGIALLSWHILSLHQRGS